MLVLPSSNRHAQRALPLTLTEAGLASQLNFVRELIPCREAPVTRRNRTFSPGLHGGGAAIVIYGLTLGAHKT